MRKLVWFLAFVAAGLWSLFVWAGYAFIGWANEAVAGAPAAWGLPPDVALWLSWAGYLFEQVGQGAAIVIWAIGLGLIALLAGILGMFFRSSRRPAERFAAPERLDHAPRPEPRPVPPAAAVPPRRDVSWGRSADRRR